MTTETAVEAVPENPFTLVQGNRGAQWLEYQSKLPIPAAPVVGERRMQFRMIPMRLDQSTEHFEKVMQLMRRLEHFEKECERLQAELDSNEAVAEVKRGRRKMGE